MSPLADTFEAAHLPAGGGGGYCWASGDGAIGIASVAHIGNALCETLHDWAAKYLPNASCACLHPEVLLVGR